MFEERFDRVDKNLDKKLDELMERTRETTQRFAGFEHDARQPRLAMEADVKPDRKRTEDAAADRAKHGNSSSVKRVDAGPTSLISFGMIAKPLALPRRDDVLVGKGTEAPEPCLSPVEIRTPPATGGLLPAGTASTAMKMIFYRPLPSWTLGEDTKEKP